MSHEALNWALNLPLADYDTFRRDQASSRMILIRIADRVAPLPPEVYESPDWKWGELPTQLGAVYASHDRIAQWAQCSRVTVLRAMRAASMCGILLRHPDPDLTWALVASVSQRHHSAKTRTNAPVTHLLNKRVDTDATWLPEAFDLATTYTLAPTAKRMSDEEMVKRMNELVPREVWPTGFSFEAAFFPDRDADMTQSSLPGISEPRRTRHNRKSSTPGRYLPERAKPAYSRSSPEVKETCDWWIAQHEKVADNRVKAVRAQAASITADLLNEGHALEDIRAAMKMCLPRVSLYIGRVEDMLVKVEGRARVVPIDAARSRNTHEDQGIYAAMAGAAGGGEAANRWDSWGKPDGDDLFSEGDLS